MEIKYYSKTVKGTETRDYCTYSSKKTHSRYCNRRLQKAKRRVLRPALVSFTRPTPGHSPRPAYLNTLDPVDILKLFAKRTSYTNGVYACMHAYDAHPSCPPRLSRGRGRRCERGWKEQDRHPCARRHQPGVGREVFYLLARSRGGAVGYS